MARTARAKRNYSLAELLGRQSPATRRDPRFAELSSMLGASSALRTARLGRRAYALLDEPRLRIEHVADFIETYRLPRSPFFRLFLAIKWDRRRRLDGRRADRDRRIAGIATTFPSGPRLLIGYLAEVERRRNPAAPMWRAELRPGTLKRAREMASYELSEWIAFFADYIERLRGSYRRTSLLDGDKLLACMLLECAPDPATGRLPPKTALRAQFKRLSKDCHPDLGGDPRRFLLISKARDELAGGS